MDMRTQDVSKPREGLLLVTVQSKCH